MTATRPKLLAWLAPLAVFGCVLAVLLALNGSDRPDSPPAANRSSERGPKASDALSAAGKRANGRHKFGAGLALGRRARTAAPDLIRPHLVIADSEIELGRYASARRAIQRLLDQRPGLPAYGRASYYRELHGDLPGAIEAMRLAIAAGGSPKSLAEVQSLAGDLELQRGRRSAARSAYRRALASVPGDPAALVGLARLSADRGDLTSAASRLRQATRSGDQENYLVLLAETYLATGKERQAETAVRQARRVIRDLRAGGTVPDADFVLLEASHGDPGRAIRLGRQVWRRLPSVRSADALGWAYTRAGQPRRGLVWARRALRLGTRDPSFRFRAGIAALRSGQRARAERDLRLALAGGAMLSPLARRQASAALRSAGGSPSDLAGSRPRP